MNRYVVKEVETVAATNNNDPITGKNSDRWKNTEVDDNSGKTKTVGNGDNLIYQNKIDRAKSGTALSKIVSHEIGDILDDGKDVIIKIPLTNLEFSDNVRVFGVVLLGVENEGGEIVASTVLKNSDKWSFMILEDNLIFNIQNDFGLPPNSTINFIIYYK